MDINEWRLGGVHMKKRKSKTYSYYFIEGLGRLVGLSIILAVFTILFGVPLLSLAVWKYFGLFWTVVYVIFIALPFMNYFIDKISLRD